MNCQRMVGTETRVDLMENVLAGLANEELAATLAASQGPAAHPAGEGWLREDVLARTVGEHIDHVAAHMLLSTWRAAFANTRVTM